MGVSRRGLERSEWRSSAPLLAAFVLLCLAYAGPATAVGPPHLICWGDSLTAGADWMERLEELGNHSWTYEDHGRGGEDSWDAAEAIDPQDSTRRFRNWLDSYTPAADDVLVFMWGTNDVRNADWAGTGPAGDGRMNHAATQAALEQIVDDALATGRPVVVAIPPPFASGEGAKHNEAEAQAFNADLSGTFRLLVIGIVEERQALGHPIVWTSVFDRFQSVSGWPDLDYFRRSNGSADGVHPGTEPGPSGFVGRYHVAEAMAPAVSGAVALSVAQSVPALSRSSFGFGVLSIAVLASRFRGARSR